MATEPTESTDPNPTTQAPFGPSALFGWVGVTHFPVVGLRGSVLSVDSVDSVAKHESGTRT